MMRDMAGLEQWGLWVVFIKKVKPKGGGVKLVFNTFRVLFKSMSLGHYWKMEKVVKWWGEYWSMYMSCSL